jgi:hypothetical protein
MTVPLVWVENVIAALFVVGHSCHAVALLFVPL